MPLELPQDCMAAAMRTIKIIRFIVIAYIKAAYESRDKLLYLLLQISIKEVANLGEKFIEV